MYGQVVDDYTASMYMYAHWMIDVYVRCILMYGFNPFGLTYRINLPEHKYFKWGG